MTTELETNYAAEMNTLDVEKKKNKKNKKRRNQNFEDKANYKQLDQEDTQRSNLNNKYLSVTLVEIS